MAYVRAILFLLVCAPLVVADEVRTLNGKTHTGTLTSVDGKEIVIKTTAGDVKVPVAEALLVDLRAVKGVPAGVKFTDVKLLDDTILHCSKFEIKGTQATLSLLGGQSVKVPLASIVLVQKDAHDPALRKEWETILKEKIKRDRVVLNVKDELNALEGTLGEADNEGKTINFRRDGGAVPVNLDGQRFAGLIFYRTEALPEAPVCNIFDTEGNILAASKIAREGEGYSITTPSGVKVTYPQTAIAKFDYNLGKLTYLSDLDPAKIIQKANLLGGFFQIKKDVNLDGEPIMLTDKQFAKGLTLQAHTELEYELGGKYKEFRAILGVDGRINANSQARVTIERDGEKVFSEVITAKKALPVVLSIREASRLRVIVSATEPGREFLNVETHVTLADAKVSQ